MRVTMAAREPSQYLAPLQRVDKLTGSGLTVPTALDIDRAGGGALVGS
jgi:hypothetical protein